VCSSDLLTVRPVEALPLQLGRQVSLWGKMPREGMRVYDPCVGSGGMLILSKQYVEEHGGNPLNIRLYGQDNNGGVWAMCKMNMILHGISDAEIHNDDTLWNPMHLDGDELMRFDRVITNPPFSQNYTRDGMKFEERFRYGFCPETGKKGDLMFLQHMLAMLRTNGMMATVMPHGVLFRGGIEKEIRKGIIQDDLLEAVIGLPPNLFYGTGIPACILVCRAKAGKPEEKRGRILFINADAEYHAGRAQNFIRPEHIEKITYAFDAFKDIPGYAAVISREDLASNDWNLNIRRYADNSPPPEPQDVRAHLLGGIPKAEVADKKDLLSAHGLKIETVFTDRDADYYDFHPEITSRSEIKERIETGKGIRNRECRIKKAFDTWWAKNNELLANLPSSNHLMTVRTDLLESFIEAISPIGLLDRFKTAGVIATWWNEILYDLKTLGAQGFEGLVDSWVEAIEAAMEEINGNHFELADDPLVVRLLPDYLQQLDQAREEILRLEQEKAAFETGENFDEVPEDITDDDAEANQVNYVRIFKDRVKELKHQIKEGGKQIAVLNGPEKKEGSIKFLKAKGDDPAPLEEQLIALKVRIKPLETEITDLEEKLKPYDAILDQLKEARKQYKTLQRKFIKRLHEARNALSTKECRDLVLDILNEKLAGHLDSYVAAHRQSVIAAVENWWDKYRVTLKDIERQRDLSRTRLENEFKKLQYA